MLTLSSLTLWLGWEQADSGGSAFAGRGETGFAGSSGSCFAGRGEIGFTGSSRSELIECTLVWVDVASPVAENLDLL